jgi:hypothetical protein
MYVSDSQNHRVQVYTFSGDTPVYSTTIGVTGVPGSDSAHFQWPQRVAIDSSDRLYVADGGNFRIQRCSHAAGWTCSTFHGTGSRGSGPGELGWTAGVATDGSDNIYIADGGNHRVKKCDSSGSCAVSATGLGWVPDVAVDSGGDVYVSLWDDCAIQKYDSSGTDLGAFKGISGVPYLTDDSHLNAPFGLAVDASGSIYASTDRGFRVLKLDGTGDTQWTLGTPGVFGSDNVHFGDSQRGPESIAVDASGTIYVADPGNHRIQIFDSSSSYVTTLGSHGSGIYEFDRPGGVAVDTGGNIYVADNYNHRVQIYNSSRVYVATLGETGVCGSDNDHFCCAAGVTVDDSGNIYVADADNNRVQVFDSSRVYQRTIGSGGGCGDRFDNFCEPRDVAVDAQGRVYVADIYNQRVQVFDSTGAYLTTIGGQWGSRTGELRHAAAVEVDDRGNVFVADEINHRIQKFALYAPGWRQVNINGFGDWWNGGATALELFNGELYAGASNWMEGARVWRATDGGNWAAVSEPGFAGVYSNVNTAIPDMIVFGSQLYAGAGWGGGPGQVWRSTDGSTWLPVSSDGFGDSDNDVVSNFAVFDNVLYAGTGNDSGAQIWRSASGDGGSWTQVATNGLGSAEANLVTGLAVFKGVLYAAIESSQGGDAQVWSTVNGTDWTPIVSDGFGDAENIGTGGFAELGGFLYVGIWNDTTGGQVWRSSNGATWTQAMGNGFGDHSNKKVESLFTFGGELFAATNNDFTGLEVWKSEDGLAWEQVNPDGFGDSNNHATLWSSATADWGNRLVIGTWNGANGGEVWMIVRQVSLPLVVRDH